MKDVDKDFFDEEKDNELLEKIGTKIHDAVIQHLFNIENFRMITDLDEAQIEALTDLEEFAINPLPNYTSQIKSLIKKPPEILEFEKRFRNKNNLNKYITIKGDKLNENDLIYTMSFILSWIFTFKINRINKNRLNRKEIIDGLKNIVENEIGGFLSGFTNKGKI